MPFPPHSNNPYLRIPKANPYSPEPARCFLAHDDETVVPHHSHHADNLEERDSVPPTVWTDDDTRRDPEEDGLMVPLQKLTAEYLYAPSTLHVESGRVSGASLTLPGGGMGKIRATPLPSGHRVEEVTLEVPVTHDKLAYALAAVENVIAGRRAFGYAIPEESRTVTTVGNEIVIRWEEHS